ncbi:uridine kinase family protein, partial [Candidatus Frankia alpina]|uniref:uridine kinase family protein n=1 Tax=Candidatus Frankia alpina TaxID=2699483 RepID=UPI0013D3F3DF
TNMTAADTVDIAVLAERIIRAAAARPRVLVGIDGPGAAGKSTLAGQLAAAIPSAHVVHVDDFYLPSSRRTERRGAIGPLVDLPRLADQVAIPGGAGAALRYQRYDWIKDDLAEWIQVPAGASLIVEGVYCLERKLRACYTFTVFCQAEPALRLARGLQRDGEGSRDQWVNEWMPAENEYMALQRPDHFAQMVVDSSVVDDVETVFRVAVV